MFHRTWAGRLLRPAGVVLVRREGFQPAGAKGCNQPKYLRFDEPRLFAFIGACVPDFFAGHSQRLVCNLAIWQLN
jgi:hypothetical protein